MALSITRRITARSCSIMLICSRSNIFIAGPSATSVEAKFAFEASEVNMNSGITSRAAMARSSACSTATKLAASRPAGRKVVLHAGRRIENRARPVLRIVPRAASRAARSRCVGIVRHELLDAAAARAAMLANQRDGRLDFGHDAHIAQQPLGPPQVLAHRRIQRQAPLHVEIDIRAAVLHVIRLDELAVDVVAEHVLHIVRIGLNAEAGRGIAGQPARRHHLVGLDEANPRHALGIDEEPQERFAVAVDPADDFLLPQLPAVFLLEVVEQLLHLHRHIVRRFHALADRRAVTVAGADDVADAVLVAVDRELVRRGQPAALRPQLAQRLFIHGTIRPRRRVAARPHRQPPAAVGIGVGLARIDEIVPQRVEDFEQAGFERMMCAVRLSTYASCVSSPMFRPERPESTAQGEALGKSCVIER